MTLRLYLVFDDTKRPLFDARMFKERYWSEYYIRAQQSIASGYACGSRSIWCDVMFCRCRGSHGVQGHEALHTGMIIFVNCAPLSWFSRRQNAVDCGVFDVWIEICYNEDSCN
jgi:hypothetical protein